MNIYKKILIFFPQGPKFLSTALPITFPLFITFIYSRHMHHTIYLSNIKFLIKNHTILHNLTQITKLPHKFANETLDISEITQCQYFAIRTKRQTQLSTQLMHNGWRSHNSQTRFSAVS